MASLSIILNSKSKSEMRKFPLAAATVLIVFTALSARPLVATNAGWQAGTAVLKITPQKPMWMSGYSSRDHAAEGTLLDLYCRVLVLADPGGHRAVLVSLDLVGIDRDFSLEVRRELAMRHGFTMADIVLACSHTHCGPVVGRNLMPMYFLSKADEDLVSEYTTWLGEQIESAVGQAVNQLSPCTLSWDEGRTTFAVNRRNNREDDVPALRRKGALAGPTDHAVPVLVVRGDDGNVRAVAFGYACHATVMAFYKWSGDYPGFAAQALEEAIPGAVALFWAGCGADQNPLPRREPQHAVEYGTRLAAAVQEVVAGAPAALAGDLRTSYEELELPLDTLPSRTDLDAQALSTDRYIAQRARMLVSRLDAGEPLAETYPYPVNVWKLGDGPTWVFLGGEVVVDYARFLKDEFGASRTWVAAYANDVMAYIPSRRVLADKGYEGETAMIYYGLPTSWGPAVEQTLLNGVRRLAAEAETVTGIGR